MLVAAKDHMRLIDTHAHLDDDRFHADMADVLDRARHAGVCRIITVATTASSSAQCIALAEQHALLSATVGIHPNHAAEASPGDWDEVVRLAPHSRVVGIGETGLDRHWDRTPFPQQEDYFARHLQLARKHKKPVIIHGREADADIARMLRDDFDRHGPVHGVMHSFAGAGETAHACLHMGLYISFAGMVTYKNAANLRELAATIPLDRLLVETDSPYLAPVPMRGKRNEPAFVAHTAGCLAEALAVSVDSLAEATTVNAQRLFGLTDKS